MSMSNDGLQDFSHEETDDLTDAPLQETTEDHDYEGHDDDVDLAEEVRLAEEDYDDEDEDGSDDEETESDENKDEDTDSEQFKTEENARNAERRRQQQLQQEQRIAEQVRAASPEVHLVNKLAQMYGTTPEQIMQNLDNNLLQQQAEREGVPVEYLQRLQQLTSEVEKQREQQTWREFEAWQGRIASEANAIKQDYPMLSDEDIQAAQAYSLNVMKDVNAPLESSVFALYGKKIVQAQREAAENEALAKASGRKAKSVNPTKAGRQAPTDTLSAEEKRVAAELGISEEDYLAYK